MVFSARPGCSYATAWQSYRANSSRPARWMRPRCVGASMRRASPARKARRAHGSALTKTRHRNWPSGQRPKSGPSSSVLRYGDRATRRICAVSEGLLLEVIKLFKNKDLYGWGARIRTWEWRNQNPLPYHLATPQRAPDHTCGSGADQSPDDPGVTLA